MQTAIPYMQIRGGSSKGLYFQAADLPADQAEKDRLLLAAMGGVDPADARQIDGLGGADPLTSKIGVIALSGRGDADIDYEFIQVIVGQGSTDRTQNCGNILAGVLPFAIESGLVRAGQDKTRARVYMTNSRSICEVIVETPGGRMQYHGTTQIDGAPGRAAPVICNFADIAGSACGRLLPSGNPIDRINGMDLTCIDNGMPVVVIRAADLGCGGYETPAELNGNSALKGSLEAIRLRAGRIMNLGDVRHKAVPKLCLISPPLRAGCIHTRAFIPHQCHPAIGVLGAVSVATACVLPGTVAADVARLPDRGGLYAVEHAAGALGVRLEIEQDGPRPRIKKAGVVRTARLLSRGEVMLPAGL